MEIIITILSSYLIGSIPFSFFMVKMFHNKNIITEGSGNAGAMNSYELSNNKLTGIIVLLIDLLKGALVVLIYNSFLKPDISLLYISAFWVVLGHNTSIFLGFKGGRGLSTAAGIFLLINPYLIISWILMWFAGYYVIRKNVHIANSIALIGSTILAFSTPDQLLSAFDFLGIGHYIGIKLLYSVVSILILIKHIKPLKELLATGA